MSDELLPVEQVDLDEAERILGASAWADVPERSRASLSLVQGLARHRLNTRAEPAGQAGRECQAVWRCAIADATGALDVLKNRWTNSRRKAEREAGDVLSQALDLLWAARNPAPIDYKAASKLGRQFADRMRAALSTPTDEVKHG